MGIFTLNINSQIIAPYQSAITSFSKGANCSGFVFENNLAIASETSIVNTVILLAPWLMSTAGLTLKNMYIRDIIYTDENSLWYEYNGVKLLPGTEYIINIVGLDYQDVVPLLKLKGLQIPNNSTTQTIDCKIALEDIGDIKYEYRNNKMIVYYAECV